MIQVNCRGDRKRFPVCLPREAMRVGLICLNAGSAVFVAGKVCNGRMPLPLQGWIGLIARLLDDGQAFDVDFDGFGAAGIDFAPDFDDGVRSDLYAHETVVVDFSADGTGAVGESISFMTLFVGDFAFQAVSYTHLLLLRYMLKIQKRKGLIHLIPGRLFLRQLIKLLLI